MTMGELDTTGTDPRKALVGLGREALAAELAAFGLEPFRARQLWHWIYHRGATSFAVMTTLAKPVRERLAEAYVIRRPDIARDLLSEDGTRKWLLRMVDGHEIETVHIPEEDRGTLCVSSQIGCTLTCSFCHTGTQRLVRNLDAAEILGQVMLARDALAEWPAPPDGRLLSNIVMMGMGEPLLNYDQVAVHLWGGSDDETLWRRVGRQSGGQPARRYRRCSRPAGTDQPEISTGRTAGRLPDLSRRHQRPPHHL